MFSGRCTQRRRLRRTRGSALTGGGNKGVTNYKDTKIETMVVSSQYYRIVVRAQSARGTVSFTETIVRL